MFVGGIVTDFDHNTVTWNTVCTSLYMDIVETISFVMNIRTKCKKRVIAALFLFFLRVDVVQNPPERLVLPSKKLAQKSKK